MTFMDDMRDDLASVFYNMDEFAEAVTIESADGDDVYHDVAAIFEFGEGIRERGADALGVEATMRVQTDDVPVIDAGYRIYRSNGDVWHVLDAELVTDGLEWLCVISRMSR